jgi:hypothetical protein
MRIRGAASNSVTCDPNALKIEARCTPVALEPITSMEGRGGGEDPGVAVGARQVEAGKVEPAWHAAGADDDLAGVESRCMLALDHVGFVGGPLVMP